MVHHTRLQSFMYITDLWWILIAVRRDLICWPYFTCVPICDWNKLLVPWLLGLLWHAILFLESKWSAVPHSCQVIHRAPMANQLHLGLHHGLTFGRSLCYGGVWCAKPGWPVCRMIMGVEFFATSTSTSNLLISSSRIGISQLMISLAFDPMTNNLTNKNQRSQTKKCSRLPPNNVTCSWVQRLWKRYIVLTKSKVIQSV